MKRTPLKRKPYTMKRSRLKAASVKRAAINRAAKKIRANFVELVGVCDLCQEPKTLIAHEVARGNRVKQFTEPACQLALCDGCHTAVHEFPKLWNKVRQMALLKLRRPEALNLERYNQLAIARITEEDLAEYEGKVFKWRAVTPERVRKWKR